MLQPFAFDAKSDRARAVLNLLGAALATIGRHATPLAAGSVFIGLLLPDLAAICRPLLVPAILLPFIVALVGVDPKALAAELRRPWLWVPMLVWVLIGSPLAVWLALRWTPIEPMLLTAIVAQASCAPLMASAAYAMLLGLDVSLAIVTTIAASALVPLTLPPIVLGLLGLEVELGALALSSRLGAMVGASFVLATLLRRWLGPVRIAAAGNHLRGLAVIGLAVFAIGVMDGVGALLKEDPAWLVACIAAVFGLTLGLQLLTALVTLPLGVRTALTLGLLAGNNNFGIVVAAMGDAAGPALLAYVAMAQFPIYLLPMLQRPIYRHWLRSRGMDAIER